MEEKGRYGGSCGRRTGLESGGKIARSGPLGEEGAAGRGARHPLTLSLWFWVVESLLLPWAGPLVQVLGSADKRDDFSELAGVLLWPAVYLVFGMFLLSTRRSAITGDAENKSAGRAGRNWSALSIAALLCLAVFEAGMVIVISMFRYNPNERDIAWMLLRYSLVAYVLHLLLSGLALAMLRRTARRLAGNGEVKNHS